jgi:hypothetical protein
MVALLLVLSRRYGGVKGGRLRSFQFFSGKDQKDEASGIRDQEGGR